MKLSQIIYCNLLKKRPRFNLYTLSYSTDTMRDVGKVAVCQMTSIADKSANLNVVTDLVRRASKDGAKMIFFPEACDYLCDNRRDTLAYAEPVLTGDTVGSYRRLAAENNVWLSIGGVHEKNPTDESKIYNTHVIVDNSGQIVQCYRKIHMFNVEIPERGVQLRESDTCTPGSHIVTPVETDIGNIGMAICYDIRFPELSTYLAMMGSDILTYPSAFTHATGEAHWEVLLRARAIETQCYVIAAAQIGEHNRRRRSYGHAMVVSPWGDVVATCGDTATPTYALCDIDLNRKQECAVNMPVFQHRRRDIYSLYGLSLRNKLLPEHTEKQESGHSDEQASLKDERRASEHEDKGTFYMFGVNRIPECCVFYKTSLTYAFVNLRCVVPGHVLVAPIRLAKRIEDGTPDELVDFFKTIVLVQKLMERVYSAKSSTVTIQDGPDAGQTVEHLHCHVMPRHPGDFKDNDLIYLELARHDRVTSDSPSKPARSLKEMSEEAEMLRVKLKTYMDNGVL